MTGTPLTAQDEAILRLEGRLLVGHTCKVIVLGADAPTIDELRARIEDRLSGIPALTKRLAGSHGRMSWVPAEDFDLRDHVLHAGSPPIEPQALHVEVGRLFTQRLDRARPLWRIDSIPLATGGTALAWRLHHTLADGTTGMRFARALLWDPGADGSADARAAQLHAADHHEERRRLARMSRFLVREFAHERSPFDGVIGTERELAFARLPLRPLHDAARRMDGATVNDAVVSAIGGGIRSWLEQHHGRLGRVRVKVPVSLHEADDGLGNADSFFFVAVPLGQGDPASRLRAVHAATRTRKDEHDAETMDQLLRDLRGVSPRLASLCERIERSPRAFALNVSNVPGPREPVAICGARVSSLHSIAEIAEHHAVRVAAVSLCDELYLGFCADPAIVGEVGSMAAATERDAAELIASA